MTDVCNLMCVGMLILLAAACGLAACMRSSQISEIERQQGLDVDG